MKKNTTRPGKTLSKNHNDINLEQIKRKYGYNKKARVIIKDLEWYLGCVSKLIRIDSDEAVSFKGFSSSGERLDMSIGVNEPGFSLLREAMLKMLEKDITRKLKELSDIPDAKVIPISFARSLCHA